MLEPFAGKRPAPVNSSRSAVQVGSNLGNSESLENMHFDNGAELGIDVREADQQIFDVRQIGFTKVSEIQFFGKVDCFGMAV